MRFYEKIESILDERQMTKKHLAEGINMPYTTLASAFNRRSKSLGLGTAFQIADFLNVGIDYLMRDEITDPNYGRNMFKLNEMLPKISGIDENGEYVESFTSNEVLEIINDLANMPDEALEEFKIIAKYLKFKYGKG